jgi:hypothetical protein
MVWTDYIGAQILRIAGVEQSPHSRTWNFVSGLSAVYNTATKAWDITVAGGGGGGSGDVVGPASSVDNRLALFSGATGKLIKQAGSVFADLILRNGSVSFTGDIDLGGNQATNSGNAAAPSDLTPLSQVESLIAAAVVGAAGGGGDGFAFTFSTTTTDADPGAGTLRFSSATLASVTSIYVDLTDTSSNDITAWLDRLDDSVGTIKGYVRVSSKTSPTKWVLFSLSAVVSATGYRKLTVAHVASGGGGLPNTTAGDTFLSFESMGIIGTLPVSSGGTGLTAVGTALQALRTNAGATAYEHYTPPVAGAGVDGFRFTYSTTTTDADPGAGTFRANNAALASATALFVDLAEHGATDITAWLDSLDDSGAAIKGRIRLQSITDATKWIVYNLTGWTTATGYRKLTVAYVAGPGGLVTTAGDTFLSYDRGVGSGDFGAGNVSTSGVGSFGATSSNTLECKSVSGRDFVACFVGPDVTASDLPANAGSGIMAFGVSASWPTASPAQNIEVTVAGHDVYGLGARSKNGIETTLVATGDTAAATRKLVDVEAPPKVTTVTSTTQISAIEIDTNNFNGAALSNCVLRVRFEAVMYQNGGNAYCHSVIREAVIEVRGGTVALCGSVAGTGIIGDPNPPSVGTIDTNGTLIRGRIAPFDATSVTIFARMSVFGVAP